MKMILAELKKRLLNRVTLAAIAAYVIGKAIVLGYVPVEMGESIKTVVSYVLDLLVVAGVLNNAGLGNGFKDVE